ncbi:alpha/beta hydrolase fold domain-containing protein [Celerinatantimonas sp. YJH-8]|uniref:alpha/beta hydrolase fold domain-containing protein n=1 Tax=Celerinatantimonas sp. YJH-8 TaxID=3228714 RepID=UPI0038C5F8C4
MPTSLPGFTQGASIFEVETHRPAIDSINPVTYSQIKTPRAMRQLQMSLLIPRTETLKPAVVYFPGGGFTNAVHEKFIQMRMALAESGFVVAAAEYRVIPDCFPAPVIDGKTAIRFLREHATDFGIDPNRIAVLGDSAGGYLSQMVALADSPEFEQGQWLHQSSKVQACVTIYGISNLLNIGEGFGPEVDDVHHSPAATEALLLHGPAFYQFAGASIFDAPEQALAASPMGYLEGPKPPMLILHGSADTLVSPEQSQQLYEALKARQQPVDYELLKNAGHGDLVWFQPAIFNRVGQWLEHHLQL